MVPEELKLMGISTDLWNEFLKLPKTYDDEVHDFRFHIHALQNIILARTGFREMQKTEEPQKQLITNPTYEHGETF